MVSRGKTGQPAKSKPVQAKKKIDPAVIEAQIELLEKRIKEMEDSFGRDTPYQAYQEYDGLVNQVSLLYEEWNEVLKEE